MFGQVTKFCPCCGDHSELFGRYFAFT